MDSESETEESKEQAKSKPNGKNGIQHGKRDPLEKIPSKNLVAASKIANKRLHKDAIKKNKIKRNKGTVKADKEDVAKSQEDAEESV